VIGDLVKELGIKELKITPRVVIPAVPLWIMPQPEVDLKILEIRQKEGQSEREAIQVRDSLWLNYGHKVQVFADASKNPDNEHVLLFQNYRYPGK